MGNTREWAPFATEALRLVRLHMKLCRLVVRVVILTASACWTCASPSIRWSTVFRIACATNFLIVPTFVRPARRRALALHFAALGAVTLDQHLSADPVRCGRELLQAGLNATCMPAFVPWPPARLCACAASPQRKPRPQQLRETLRPLLRKQASQIGSNARTRRRRPVDHGLTYSRVRAGGWISRKAAGRPSSR
jgi:hypothetical protein